MGKGEMCLLVYDLRERVYWIKAMHKEMPITTITDIKRECEDGGVL